MDPNRNRVEGNIFEDLFKGQAQRDGLLVLKNWYSCRFIGRGKVLVIKGQLDFTLSNQEGKVGFFDCKSYANDYFVYSDLDEDQVKRSILYNDYNIPSGFIVWFRPTKNVYFFSGRMIALGGPRNRFTPDQGRLLGRFENFDLKGLL